jgi:hypothetical protein
MFEIVKEGNLAELGPTIWILQRDLKEKMNHEKSK